MDLFFLKRQLEHRAPEVFSAIDEFARCTAISSSEKRESGHQKKLASLQARSNDTQESDKIFVKNLSSRALSATETHVLAKGKKFNLTTTKPPIASMATAVEYGLHQVDPGIREEARLKAISVLSKVQRGSRLNYTTEEKAAIKNLKEDKNIVILPADKGNATVVMDRTDYDDKAHKLLATTAYMTLPKDPTTKIQATLNKTLSSIFGQYPDSRNLYLSLICRNGSTPAFYGLPKIHKPSVPLRPKVDFTTSPLRALSNYLHRLL